MGAPVANSIGEEPFGIKANFLPASFFPVPCLHYSRDTAKTGAVVQSPVSQ
jgi:hypothetical protein